MKNKIILLIVGALLAGGLIGWQVAAVRRPRVGQPMPDNSFNPGPNQGLGQSRGANLNRGNCLADDCLLVDDLKYPAGELTADAEEALAAAILDEYKALAIYQAVVEKFGSTRPFSMIINAEEQHIASLKALFDKYGLTVPENTYTGQIEVPDSLTEACQTGVEAEIANAELYRNELLPVVEDYEDITLVFTNLMRASEEKHLPAFEKCN